MDNKIMEMRRNNLSELICSIRCVSQKTGNIAGNCIFCGHYTDCGHPAKLKANFTGYPYLQAGEAICPFCYELYNNEQYRKSMWFVANNKFQFFKRSNAKEILLTRLPTPFAIYITKTWKKQGWIRLLDKVNYNTDNFFIGFDYDIIFVERKKLNKYFGLISELLKKKISKTELALGKLKPKSFEKIEMDVELASRIKLVSGDKLWDLCLFVSTEGEKNG